jgi:hypothetical protein
LRPAATQQHHARAVGRYRAHRVPHDQINGFGHPGLLMQLNSEYEFEPSMFLILRVVRSGGANQCWGIVRTVANCHEPQPVVQPEIAGYTSHD